MRSPNFRVCSGCGTEWPTMAQFILDTNLRLTGYQAVFGEVEYGLFIITHEQPDCMTSNSLTVGLFRDLFPKHQGEMGFIDPKCEDRCYSQVDLMPCNVACSMKWARDVLQCLKEHKLPPNYQEDRFS